MEQLTLRLSSLPDGKYRSEVVGSPFGDRPHHDFDAPLSAQEVERYEAWSTDYVAAVAAGEALPAPAPGLSAEEVGSRLHAAFLGGEIGDHLQRCLARYDKLRLCIQLDPADERGEDLARLPWELVYDPEAHRFFGRRRRTPLVRSVAVPHPLEPLLVEPPLRVLIVAGANLGPHRLDLDAEHFGIARALAPLERKGQVEWYAASTLDEIRRRVVDDGIHVLHYMGHGGYLDEQGLGALFLDDGKGGSTQIDGDLLSEFLTGSETLRLVVLNACRSARHAGADSRPLPYSLTGGILQRTGRTVLAMQQVISDAAAVEFGGAFYRRLAANDPVDVAVAEARLALAQSGAEWATPVLFLSAPDGRLFDVQRGESDRRPEVPPRRLGIRTFVAASHEQDLGEMLVEDCQEVLDLRYLFEGRIARREGGWQREVFPALAAGLNRNTLAGRPLYLDFAAHFTAAFAAGWVQQAKGRLPVSVHQRGMGEAWHAADGSGKAAGTEVWEPRPDLVLNRDLPDVALVVAASREIVVQVKDYIEAAGLPVGRIVDAVALGGTGQDSVAGGAHAAQLAQALESRVQVREPHEVDGRLHVFASVPNGLAFLIGQLSRPWGGLVLYEYQFDSPGGPGSYYPSLHLPPPADGGANCA